MNLENDAIIRQILDIKKSYGRDLIILSHHYQRPEIVYVGDYRGDSYLLCRKAFESDAEYIIFCGVRFMAESAEILRRENQKVYHPDPFSGCPMADMAEVGDVIRAFEYLNEIWGRDTFVPVVYMNSSAEVKSVAGKIGGIICTSSNADRIISHVFSKDKRVIFLPDEYLGINTFNRMNIDRSYLAFWDYSLDFGGNDPDELKRRRYVVWKGYCHVHTFFTPQHIISARRNFKDCKIVVHPECSPEVVALADAVGSTEFIVRYVENASTGSTIIIGTELNLVRRLASYHRDKRILDLARSMCPNMFKITTSKLLNTLTLFPDQNRVVVPQEVKEYSRLALTRMLEVAGQSSFSSRI